MSLCCDARPSPTSVVAAGAAGELVLMSFLVGGDLLFRVKPPLVFCILLVVALLPVLRFHVKLNCLPTVVIALLDARCFCCVLITGLKGSR